MNETIFRKKSLERIASPDKLDDYLKVAGPSAWIILAGLILMVAAAGVWCFFGSIPTTVTGVGVRSQSGVICFLSTQDGYTVSSGMKARVTYGKSEEPLVGVVAGVREPIKAEQAVDSTGTGWLIQSIPDSWVRPVSVQLGNKDIPAGTECSVQIILDERRPIDLLLGR